MGKYIYCLIQKKKNLNLNLSGIEGNKVYFINYGKLAAAVSDSSIKDHPLTRGNIVTHQQVIEEVMQNCSAVLPASFGMVAENSDDILKKILAAKQDELMNALREIEGKVELNLKALWLDMPKIFQNITLENPELAQMKKELSNKVLARDEAIKIGEFVAEKIESRKEKIREEIIAMLEDLFTEYKKISLFGEQMIFNLAFLADKNKQRKFDEVIKNLDDKYKEENIYFKYIGPTPPFNFVKVSINL